MMIHKRCIRRGFTLIELLVVIAIIALLISILLPSLASSKESARQTVCGTHLKGLATSSITYAAQHSGWWPTVASNSRPFYCTTGDEVACEGGNSEMEPDNLGPLTSLGGTTELPRDRVSRDIPESSPAGGGPSGQQGTHVSPTRGLWLLIRAGDVAPAMFVCPSSKDIPDPTRNAQLFYDFKGYDHISYGYQMPFYVAYNVARPSQDRQPDMVMLGDKSPGVARGPEAVESVDDNDEEGVGFSTQQPDKNLWTLINTFGDPDYINPGSDWSDPEMRQLNSPNHGGRDNGVGQNVAHRDGHVTFEETPLAGVNQDNIYSMQIGGDSNGYNPNKALYAGTYPYFNSVNKGCPGYRAGPLGAHASTDSLLFP